MLTTWKQQLDPVIANPIIQGRAITGVILNAGKEVNIPTGLGRMQQGWIITDQLVNCYVKRTQPFTNNLLTLESSADTTISIWVY